MSQDRNTAVIEFSFETDLQAPMPGALFITATLQWPKPLFPKDWDDDVPKMINFSAVCSVGALWQDFIISNAKDSESDFNHDMEGMLRDIEDQALAEWLDFKGMPEEPDHRFGES